MVILEKRKPISLVKNDRTFPNFTINLNWNEGDGGGFFSKMFGKKSAIDLDLGCFIELENGDIHCLQPLGNKFGELRRAPYVQHSGDDRSGSDASGETITVNGREWENINRILVYTYIYEGTPSWELTDAVVTVDVPGQEQIVVKMGEQRTPLGTCGLVLLENKQGTIKISKEMNFFESQQPLDRHYGFGFSWSRGSK